MYRFIKKILHEINEKKKKKDKGSQDGRTTKNLFTRGDFI